MEHKKKEAEAQTGAAGQTTEKAKTETASTTAGQVATTQTSAVPAVGRGHEVAKGQEMSQEDFEIPRAQVVQFTSDAAQAVSEADRVSPGRFINSLSKVDISPVFIPIKRYTTYTRWNPRKKEDPNYDPAYEIGEMIFTTNDRHDPRVVEGINFGPNNETPKVTKVFNFLCYFEGQRLPLLLSFAKTSFKAGKILNTLLEEAGGDMFENKFKLTFKLEDKAGTKYYVMEVRANGKATPEEFAKCEAWYNRFASADIEKMATKQEGHQE